MKGKNTALIAILMTVSMLIAGFMAIAPGAEAATFGLADKRVNDSGSALFVQSAPDIAIDGSDNIYVVWEDNRNGNYDIYISKSIDNGAIFQADVKVDNTNTADQKNPTMVTYGANDVYVVWQDLRDGNWDIYFARSTDWGLNFDPFIQVSDAGGNSEQSSPAIAVDDGGDIYVVWQDLRNGDWDIYLARSTDNGNSFDANVKVNSASNADQSDPSVAVNSEDDIFVVWQDDRNGDDDIFIARSTNEGESFQNRGRVDDDNTGKNQRFPMLAIDDSDDIFVAWEDERNDNWDVYLAKSTNDGNSFQTNIMVNDGSTADQQRPSIAVDINDNIHVAWYDARGGNDHIYYTKSTDAGSSFGTDSRVCSTNGAASSQDAPAIAVNSGMDPVIAWEDSRNGNADIYLNRGANNPPGIAIMNPTSGSTVSGTLTISGTASDPDGSEELVSVEVRIDGGGWITATGTSSWSFILNTNSRTNGQHTIYVRAYDGDLYSATESRIVNVYNPSNQAPLVAIWSPVPGSTLSGSEAVVAGNSTDPDGDSIFYVQVKIDNGNWITAEGTNGWAAWVYSLDTTTLSNGQHTIYARSYDGALYSDLSSVIIVAANAGGNVAPAVSITKPLNEEKVTDNYLLIEVTATDQNGNAQVERVEIKIDNGSWEEATPAAGQDNLTAWNYYLYISDLPLEKHSIYARAYDGMVYSTEDSVTVEFSKSDGGSPLPWLLIAVILLLLFLLLLLLMKRRKEKPENEFEMRPAQHQEWQGGYEQQPPEMPTPSPPPGELIEP